VSRSRAGEKKPGACGTKYPWKVKDVPERFNELRNGLARIRREVETWDDDTYEKEVASWAGQLSETWESIFKQEVVGALLADGGLELRPQMVRMLVQFSETDNNEFQASYGWTSQWAKRHDKSAVVNYVPPESPRSKRNSHAWISGLSGSKPTSRRVVRSRRARFRRV